MPTLNHQRQIGSHCSGLQDSGLKLLLQHLKLHIKMRKKSSYYMIDETIVIEPEKKDFLFLEGLIQNAE